MFGDFGAGACTFAVVFAVAFAGGPAMGDFGAIEPFGAHSAQERLRLLELESVRSSAVQP